MAVNETEHQQRPWAPVLGALRAVVDRPGRRWLVVATVLLGVAITVVAAIVLPAVSVAVLVAPAQLIMSILVPLAGVLLAHDLLDHDGPELPVLLAAVLYAVAIGLVGVVVGLVVAAVTPGARFGEFAPALAGGVAVQVTAQLVGTGLGLLIHQRTVAFLASIILPLGVWEILGLVGAPSWLQDSLTPIGVATRLVSGAPTLSDWLGWVLVLVLWGVVLNVAGVTYRRHRAETGASPVG